MTRIFILSSAGILAVLAMVALLLGPRPEPPAPTGPVVIETTDPPEPEIVAVETATPSPAPREPLPPTACTLLVERRPVLTLASEDALRTLLMEYLASCTVAPEGERFVSAAFCCELIFVPAAEDAALSDYDDALMLLKNTPETVPVRLTTEKRTRTEVPIETSSTNDGALAKGSRIIRQLGFTGSTLWTQQRVYVGGKLESEGEAVEAEKREGRALMIRTGAWTSRGAEPGPREGERARDTGELDLRYPMRGTVSAYFGMYNGSMHNGVDIQARAGTAIVAPGEGVVVYCGLRGAYGYVIDIDHGHGFVSRLTHIDADSVQIEFNQRVFAGDALGSLAAAAADKTPHLHYELLIDSVPHNPLLYIGD